jgi:hypothetical protein
MAYRSVSLNVAIPRFRARRSNSEYDEVSRYAGLRKSRSNQLSILADVTNVSIRWQHHHQCVSMLPRKVYGGKPDRGGSIPPDWLGQNVCAGHFPELPPDQCHLITIRDDPKIVALN